MAIITGYTQSGNGWFLSYIPSWWKNQPWLHGEGGGVHAHTFSFYLPSRTKLQCTLQLRGQIQSTYFTSTPTVYVLCDYNCNINIHYKYPGAHCSYVLYSTLSMRSKKSTTSIALVFIVFTIWTCHKGIVVNIQTAVGISATTLKI